MEAELSGMQTQHGGLLRGSRAIRPRAAKHSSRFRHPGCRPRAAFLFAWRLRSATRRSLGPKLPHAGVAVPVKTKEEGSRSRQSVSPLQDRRVQNFPFQGLSQTNGSNHSSDTHIARLAGRKKMISIQTQACRKAPHQFNSELHV